ncbi:Activator of Hsp90 ATPase, N-terminal [Teratosphaeria destructans]|uniref:Activator of Hsp90 ATPase, N-terminal n=1 Tax=Teratosphaeria destructans TaxID=418781 RepID=A0A9W7STA4_9PEZI|nr:Activator of Hsp90 ATPase, N-terminal [Teratosphaeria destructans]
MVLHNPNNWHWVNKDVSAWTQDYLNKSLVGIKASKDDGTAAEVSKVLSMDGDVDVSQRKGKVITIFDVKLQLEWTGKAPLKESEKTEGQEEDTKEVSGTITIPEVAHDTEEDEYVFEVEVYSSDLSKEPVKDLVRKEITPQLRKHLQKLGPALIAEHGRDIQHAPGSNPSSGFSTPRIMQNSSVAKQKDDPKSTSNATAGAPNGPKVNVTSLSDQQEFRTTAEQLYETFTDPQRIAAFTRAPPKVFEGAKEGGKFEIFGGNVSGAFVKLEKPTYIEQKWRLAQWPQGHFSTLKVKFEQNDVDAVTIMRVDWEGVPIGQEEPTKTNWEQYYVRSIKTTFGFGTIL